MGTCLAGWNVRNGRNTGRMCRGKKRSGDITDGFAGENKSRTVFVLPECQAGYALLCGWKIKAAVFYKGKPYFWKNECGRLCLCGTRHGR